MKFMMQVPPTVPAGPEERGRDRPVGQFHNEFYPRIPTTVKPLIGATMMSVGTVDDVHRKLAMIRERMNPEWMMILVDQGFLPFDEVKRQTEIFAAKVMPEFLG